MQYSQLIARIQADIYNNGAELITGDILQGDLLAIISALASAGAGYGGIITPESSAPASLDQATFYIAIQPGTYSSFGVTVTEPSIVSYGGGETLTFTVSPLGLAAAPTVVKLNNGDDPYVLVPLTGTDGMAFTVDIEGGYSGGATEVYAQRWLVNYSVSNGVTIYVTGDQDNTNMISWAKVYDDNGDLFLVMYANTRDLDYVTMAFRDMTGDPVPGVDSVASIAGYPYSSDAVIIKTEYKNNKVSTISGNETNTTKYPNTKAVADYVAKIGEYELIKTITPVAGTTEYDLADATIYEEVRVEIRRPAALATGTATTMWITYSLNGENVYANISNANLLMANCRAVAWWRGALAGGEMARGASQTSQTIIANADVILPDGATPVNFYLKYASDAAWGASDTVTVYGKRRN